MPQEITKQRWESAQTEELSDHIHGSYDLNFYKNIYNNIFSLLEMNPNKFENNLKIYHGNSIQNFHSADCIYGTIKIK